LTKVTPEDALRIEKRARDEFRGQALLYLHANILRTSPDDFGWWALMQHHSAPTRLLDWSRSPYVAAYFAVQDGFEFDGAVWVYNDAALASLNRASPEYKEFDPHGDQKVLFRQADAPEHLYSLFRTEQTDRMIAQQGIFTICRNVLGDHGEIIDRTLGPHFDKDKNINYVKIIISLSLKPDFLRRLRTMNIAANALFPGIDGIGRSVYEAVRLLRIVHTPQPLPTGWYGDGVLSGTELSPQGAVEVRNYPDASYPEFPVVIQTPSGTTSDVSEHDNEKT
jgi:hypothetical protein